MLRVGFTGWRGMVGSVLLERMREENDFADIEPTLEAPLPRRQGMAARSGMPKICASWPVAKSS